MNDTLPFGKVEFRMAARALDAQAKHTQLHFRAQV